MKKITLIILLFISILLGNCATGPTHGALFTYNSFAGTFNPANDVKVTKTAKSCQHSILNLFGFGNASAGEIAFENGIGRIATVDHSTMSILSIVYKNYCTIVSGEVK